MIDPARLGQMLSQRRRKEGWSLRRTADEIGVSFNTVARIEKGYQPDLHNYRKLVAWLGLAEAQGPEAVDDPLESAITHLRQDPALTQDAAERMGRVMREMYEALAQPTQTSAVHLRTASALRPEAARLLGELLSDMRIALESEHATG
jgi:transcriptional regulator with XRE-family HTH domain